MVFDAFRKQPSSDVPTPVTPLWRRGAASLALGAMLGTTGAAGLTALPSVTLPAAHAVDSGTAENPAEGSMHIQYGPGNAYYTNVESVSPPQDLGSVYVELTSVEDPTRVYYSDPAKNGTWQTDPDGNYYQDFGGQPLPVGKYKARIVG